MDQGFLPEAKPEKKKGEYDSEGALFIPAGVLGGLGFGFVFNNIPAGLFLGLGLGFALFALVELWMIRRS